MHAFTGFPGTLTDPPWRGSMRNNIYNIMRSYSMRNNACG